MKNSAHAARLGLSQLAPIELRVRRTWSESQVYHKIRFIHTELAGA